MKTIIQKNWEIIATTDILCALELLKKGLLQKRENVFFLKILFLHHGISFCQRSKLFDFYAKQPRKGGGRHFEEKKPFNSNSTENMPT